MTLTERADQYLLDNNYPAIQHERRLISDLLEEIKRYDERIAKLEKALEG